MRPSETESSSEYQYRYGFRYVQRTQSDGRVDFDQVPLTLEDVLHPQEGDVIAENTDHDVDRAYLATVFRDRVVGPPVALVTSDVLVNWGIADLRDHAPDLAVFVGLRSDPRPTGLIRVAELGGRCEAVVEIVSPNHRTNDVDTKVEHYRRVGIPLYVIIDQQADDAPRTLLAYRLRKGRYQQVAPDSQGRVAIPVLRLSLGLQDNHPLCFDMNTGEELGNYSRLLEERDQARQAREQLEEEMGEQVEARQEAERNAREARQGLEQAEKVAERAQQEAERAQQEAERAQQEAERAQQEAERAQQEAERAQKHAERAEKQADRARKQAERERLAREKSEQDRMQAEDCAAQRIRDLEEMVRRLQTGGAAAD